MYIPFTITSTSGIANILLYKPVYCAAISGRIIGYYTKTHKLNKKMII